MRFRLVMWILGLRLRWLGRRNEKFAGKLSGRNVLMQWRTKAGTPARWFHFSDGGVRSGAGLHPAPTVALSFEDAAYAFNVLKQAAGNQMVFMEGMQQQKIAIEGDVSQMMWFMSLMKFIAPKR
ncbi:hypothetical protein [Isoalcanivorax beigongshangi]|uniref:SCP-2 sterol transfer family protein n=1 Tax=Isoalcanivorax beigongshangi TaxID=3238810 RepID=A0ABV4AFZ4_9GAMM